MTEIAIGPAALSALSTEARAAIIVAAQRRHGLDVKQPRVKRVLSNALEASVVVCDGEVCTPTTVRLALSRPIRDVGDLDSSLLPGPMLDAVLARRLLSQPLAMVALIGTALLTCSLAVENAATDALLSLIGGRASGLPMRVCIGAWVAHAVEAAIALVTMLRTPNCGAAGALPWAALTLLVGFPVLRHVLALRPKA